MASSIIGAAVKRVEDPRLLTGAGRFLDDIHVDDALWMAVVRSTVPHGRLGEIDTAAALEMPGVVGVFTARDVGLAPLPSSSTWAPEASRPILAEEVVRFVGEPIAVVVAEDRRTAVDAAAAVWVDVEPLPSFATIEAALAVDAPVLFESVGSNLIAGPETTGNAAGDPLAAAEVVVAAEIVNQRLEAIPLEPNNALAVPRGESLEWWVGSQNVFIHQVLGARILGIDKERLRVRVPDIGGGFGAKILPYPEQILTAALALRLGRPVRWQETRSENMVGMTQGRDQRHRIELGATRDGRLVGLRMEVTQNAGAYPLFGAVLPEFTTWMASGPYVIPMVEATWRSVVTNTSPVHAYRGAGRPEATSMLERAMDLLAAELQMDPAELRRRNFVRKTSFPFTTPTDAHYDSGDYEAALDRVLELAGYEELRRDQAARRRRGDRLQLGIGISSYVEVTAAEGGKEWGAVDVLEDGTVVVKVGTSAHGQGHATSFAQIVAAEMQVPIEQVEVIEGDTALVARGGGTMASRSLQLGGTAVLEATDLVVDKAKQIVAHLREAAVADIVVFPGGAVGVAGVPDSAYSWAELSALAHDPANLPPGMEPGLAVAATIEQDDATYPFGSHVAVVEVDVVTGETRLVRHVAVDDAGTIVNRMILDGQIHGGIAQAAGQALSEWARYDDDGYPLTTNLTTYLIPSASTLPSFELDHTVTPTPLNPLGVKGVGEAGTIGATPAIQNAAVDAVAHLGVTHIDMPVTAARMWEALRSVGFVAS